MFTAILALAAAGVQAAPRDIVNFDFADAAVAGNVQLNGKAALVTVDGKQRLRLTSAANQVASAFPMVPAAPIGDLTASFDFEVRPLDGDDNPEGGFLFIVQTAGPTARGANGGNIGLTHRTYVGPGKSNGQGFFGYSYALEFDTLDGQGFSDNPEVTALDLMGTRTRFGIEPLPHSGLGVLHAEVRVKPDQLTLTLSGGKDNLAPKVVYTSPTYIGNGVFKPADPVYFGFTAGTAGGQITDIYNLHVQTDLPQ
jgi:hypothetical protein